MLKVECFVCNDFSVNSYIVYDVETLEAAIIDPGCSSEAEWNPMEYLLKTKSLKVKYILITHSHVDHIMGTGFAADRLHIAVSGSKDDEACLPTQEMQARFFGVPSSTLYHPIDIDLKEGSRLSLGEEMIEVIDIPGHSFHGLLFYAPSTGILFSGDVLFRGSIGRSDFGANKGCNGQLLLEGIHNKILSLPDNTIVYPGHGPYTTIATERFINPYL